MKNSYKVCKVATAVGKKMMAHTAKADQHAAWRYFMACRRMTHEGRHWCIAADAGRVSGRSRLFAALYSPSARKACWCPPMVPPPYGQILKETNKTTHSHSKRPAMRRSICFRNLHLEFRGCVFGTWMFYSIHPVVPDSEPVVLVLSRETSHNSYSLGTCGFRTRHCVHCGKELVLGVPNWGFQKNCV